MENGRGSGIFFGIVSIATLIVAIIGATFAYFSASITSDPNAVGAGAYEFVNASIQVEQFYPVASANADGLIPLDYDAEIPGAPEEYNTNLKYALNLAEEKCIDDYGYQVCVVFKVTVLNSGRQTIDLAGKLKTTRNEQSPNRDNSTPFSNLAYHAIKINEDESIDLIGEAVPLSSEPSTAITVGSEIEISGLSVGPAREEYSEEEGKNVTVPGTAVSYILLYLEDSKDAEGKSQDQSGEMGAIYEGQLIYTSGAGNGSQLTGTFRVSGTNGGGGAGSGASGEESPQEPSDNSGEENG